MSKYAFPSTRVADNAAPIQLLHPLGAQLAGASGKAWIRVEHLAGRDAKAFPLDAFKLRARWTDSGGVQRGYVNASLSPTGKVGAFADAEVTFHSPPVAGSYDLTFDLVDTTGATLPTLALRIPVLVQANQGARASVLSGVQPLSYAWGTDRGLPAHRKYLEDFLVACSGDVKGHCLEFQEPRYTHRLGGAKVAKLDILHVDDSNPIATIVADITKPNAIAANQFDCIICTHVLHVIYEVELAVKELHRMLKPGGVLLAAVPHISMSDPQYGELWRFTPEGLSRVCETCFDRNGIDVRAYGNSLIAAGELRGLVSAEFTEEELAAHDPWFPVEVCVRAIKGEG